MDELTKRAAEKFEGAAKNLKDSPFVFIYGDKEYRGLGDLGLSGVRTENRPGLSVKYIDLRLDDAVKATLKLSFWEKYGALEQTLFFENDSDKNSLVFKKLAVRMEFSGDMPRVDGIMGDHDNFYRPYSHDLTASDLHFFNNSGRATHVTFPYFDLRHGKGGTLLAIGWAGSWRSDFAMTDCVTVWEAATPADIQTYLKPGEKLRSALYLTLPYPDRRGEKSSNLWRRWFIECNMPRANAAGDPLKPFSTAFFAYDTGRHNTDGSMAESRDSWRPSMDKMISEGLKTDFRWIDAGWYSAPDGSSPDGSCWEKDWFNTVGTWEPDKTKWPGKSLLETTEYARQNGMKTLMWFEPERVAMVDELVKNYGYDPSWSRIQLSKKSDNHHRYSNNIGDPECYKWTSERIKKTLRENRIEMYREDNNIDAGAQWRQMDAEEGEDRRGITEMKLICAHYALWDEIIECTSGYGGCAFVDSCASGGGRNDLESMKRGVPLLRSDFDRTTTGIRLSMTTAFNKWIPFCGACTREQKGQIDLKGVTDKYVWRASYLAVLNTSFQYLHDPTIDFDVLRAGFEEWKRVKEYLLGGFYVHTPWRSGGDVSGFVAFSYVVESKAVLFAFRQENCRESELKLRLPYLNTADPVFEDADGGSVEKCGARARKLSFPAPRTSRLIYIDNI